MVGWKDGLTKSGHSYGQGTAFSTTLLEIYKAPQLTA